MSFRDFSSRGRPQAMELEGEHGHKNQIAVGRTTTPRKSPLRRGVSDGNTNSYGNGNGNGSTNRPSQSRNHYQQYKPQHARSRSEPTYQNNSNDHHQMSSSYHAEESTNHNNNNNNSIGPQQSLLVQQREEEYANQVMQQRETELRDIHKKMHVVNEIYKDLGGIVEQQQDQIDQAETHFGDAADATKRGLEQIEKANSRGRKAVADGIAEDQQADGVEGGLGRKQQFAVLRYLSKGANELTKMISACTSGNANYVDESSWIKTKKR